MKASEIKIKANTKQATRDIKKLRRTIFMELTFKPYIVPWLLGVVTGTAVTFGVMYPWI